ncbi:hypothetical protein [Pararhizobium sp.]|uniref:hypothetical protein n=1 Tax=Pararhizobium sp. TaxID=1977563 RepID=UPI00271E6065|nr:hypothetical protein [Pararhizobium sp.]MDO9415808.1 hypothetical protein [Pararhizobium sp.]
MLSSGKNLEIGAVKTAESTPATASKTSTPAQVEPSLDLLELELSLDVFTAGAGGFTAAMREAARKLRGEFLFDLPASGLAEDCSRIAVLRIPSDDRKFMRTIFACLNTDATSVRIEEPGEATEGLKNFADAFVDVLQQI